MISSAEQDKAAIAVRRAIQWAMTKRFLFLFNAFTFAIGTILITSSLIFNNGFYSQITSVAGRNTCGDSNSLHYAYCRFILPLWTIASIETLFWTVMTSICFHGTSIMSFYSFHNFNKPNKSPCRTLLQWFVKSIGVILFSPIFGHLFFKIFYSSPGPVGVETHPELVYSLIQSSLISLAFFTWLRSDQLVSSMTRMEPAPTLFSTRFKYLLIDSIQSATKLALVTGTTMFLVSSMLAKSTDILIAVQFIFRKSIFKFLPTLNVDVLHFCFGFVNSLANPMGNPVFHSQSIREFILVQLMLPFLLFLGLQLSLGLMIFTLTYPMDFSKIFDSSDQAKQLSSKELGLVFSIATDCYINNRGLHWAQNNKTQPPDASRPPLWTEIIKIQREMFDAMLNSCSTTKHGFGLPPVRALEKLSLPSFDGIVRSLALQDFARLSRGYQHRRLKLYADNWAAVALASCATLDALTLQLQLASAHVSEEVIQAVNDSSNGTGKLKDSSTAASATATTGIRGADPVGHGVKWEALDIIANNRRYREQSTIFGIVVKILLDFEVNVKLFSWLEIKQARLVEGTALEQVLLHWIGATVTTDPVSSMAAQDGIHAMEGLSLCLQAAVREDSRGVVQHHLPAVLQSLLALELSIRDYGDSLRHAISLKRCRLTGYYRQQKAKTGSLVSAEMQALTYGLDEALNRIVRTYRDVIPTLRFSSVYDDILQRRLAR